MPTLLGSQYILSGLILVIILKTVNSFRKKRLTRTFFISWVFFWTMGLVLVLNPYLLSTVATLLGIGRGVDFALYVSVILIFYLIFKQNEKISELERKITKIIRIRAIDEKK